MGKVYYSFPPEILFQIKRFKNLQEAREGKEGANNAYKSLRGAIFKARRLRVESEPNEPSSPAARLRAAGAARCYMSNYGKYQKHLCDMPFLHQAPPGSGWIWTVRSEMARCK